MLGWRQSRPPSDGTVEAWRDSLTNGVSVTKSERLMFLVNMLKTRRALSVQQMSSTCEVSERTIYRDLGSLSRMNIPIYYDNGYRLAREVGFPGVDFGVQDLELLCYCLRHHPLTDHPFFARRFRIIERKIRERIRSRPGLHHTSCLLDSFEDPSIVASAEYNHVARFLTALFDSVVIAIQSKGTATSRLLYPVALRVRRCSPYFVVTESLDSAPLELPASDIIRIRRTARRINVRDLEPYRRRWLADPSDEKSRQPDDRSTLKPVDRTEPPDDQR